MSARLRHTYHPDLADQPEKPFTVDADDIKHFPMSPFRPPHLGNFQPSHRGAEKYRHFVGRPNLRRPLHNSPESASFLETCIAAGLRRVLSPCYHRLQARPNSG